MLEVQFTSQFRKDSKKLSKERYELDWLKETIGLVAEDDAESKDSLEAMVQHARAQRKLVRQQRVSRCQCRRLARHLEDGQRSSGLPENRFPR